jgi:hypothetical protein
MHGSHGESFHVSVCILGRMEQAVPDLTSPRVYQSPGGAGAHLSGLNKLLSGTLFRANWCWDLSCHGLRIGQDHPGRLKLGLLVLLTALYKVHWSLLKSDIYFWFSGEPKKSLRTIFDHRSYDGVSVKCTTIWHSLSITDGY